MSPHSLQTIKNTLIISLPINQEVFPTQPWSLDWWTYSTVNDYGLITLRTSHRPLIVREMDFVILWLMEGNRGGLITVNHSTCDLRLETNRGMRLESEFGCHCCFSPQRLRFTVPVVLKSWHRGIALLIYNLYNSLGAEIMQEMNLSAERSENRSLPGTDAQ